MPSLQKVPRAGTTESVDLIWLNPHSNGMHNHSKSNCYPTNCQLWLDRQWVKPKWLRMMMTLIVMVLVLLSLLPHLFLLLRTKRKVNVTSMNITQGSNAQHGRQLKSGPFASQYRNVSFR